MKIIYKLIFVSAFAISAIFIGCSPGPNYVKADLQKQVAFDKDCTVEKVNVLQEANLAFGSGDFKVEACGNNYKYKLTGTVYQEAK